MWVFLGLLDVKFNDSNINTIGDRNLIKGLFLFINSLHPFVERKKDKTDLFFVQSTIDICVLLVVAPKQLLSCEHFTGDT